MTSQEALAALATGTVPPDTVYIQVDTPLGSVAVDPFAAALDPAAQSRMQQFGIKVTMGFGPPPVLPAGTPSLGMNLTIGATLAVGALAMYMRPKLSTALFVGGMAFLINRGMFMPGSSGA